MSVEEIAKAFENIDKDVPVKDDELTEKEEELLFAIGSLYRMDKRLRIMLEVFMKLFSKAIIKKKLYLLSLYLIEILQEFELTEEEFSKCVETYKKYSGGKHE